jgi:hypothetical protein
VDHSGVQEVAVSKLQQGLKKSTFKRLSRIAKGVRSNEELVFGAKRSGLLLEAQSVLINKKTEELGCDHR